MATAAQGYVERVIAESGQRVRAGQPLLQLADPELAFEIRTNRAQMLEAGIRRRQAIAQSGANLRTIHGVLDSLGKREAELARRERELTVTAAHDGLWVAPRINDSRGRWYPRGSVVGEIVNPAKFVFVARVPTRDALRVVSREVRGAAVRLLGQPGHPIATSAWRFAEAAAEEGEKEKERRDGSAPADAKLPPAIEVRAELPATPDGVALLHGQSGMMRIELPWEPLLNQWARKLRQIFQNRPA